MVLTLDVQVRYWIPYHQQHTEQKYKLLITMTQEEQF